MVQLKAVPLSFPTFRHIFQYLMVQLKATRKKTARMFHRYFNTSWYN